MGRSRQAHGRRITAPTSGAFATSYRLCSTSLPSGTSRAPGRRWDSCFSGPTRRCSRPLPARKPDYANPRISSYHYLAEVGADEERDPYYYGLSLIRRILGYPAQEIGTHTFSHFYCLEEGGGAEAFRADLEAARAAAAHLGVSLASIVFPRNQVSPVHLAVSREFGLRAFRGNERAWFHRARRDREQNLLVRGCRLADSYLPLAGPHDREPALVGGLVDVPASRFLRPVSGNARAGALAPLAHHLGHGNGGASPKAFSSMVASAQFRGRLTRKFGIPSQNPRSFSHPARPLWHALDDDGGGRRRGTPCPRTKWCCSPMKVSPAASPHAISLPASLP